MVSSWLCFNKTGNTLVKIVHGGGHVELHDRPVLAAEIILRNPRCVVAHPHVFRQPWAIVPPETMLMPGQKFYVVPISTIRNLQKHADKYSQSQSPVKDIQSTRNSTEKGKDDNNDDNTSSSCWVSFMHKNSIRSSYSYLKQSDENEGEKGNTIPNAMHMSDGPDGCCSDDQNCFLCLPAGIIIKGNRNDSSHESRSPSSSESPESSKRLTRSKSKNFTIGSPKRFMSSNQWQPSLESISEE